jgi:predicted Fe-Mo cluster-binding NifX family protein
MGHRIALATTDRLTLFTHFGKAEEFHIVDIEGEDYSFIEVRNVPPSCNGGSHNENAFDVILDIISDCEAVVVGKIGYGAADYVRARGLRVFEAPGMVEQIMDALIHNGYFDPPEYEKLQKGNAEK